MLLMPVLTVQALSSCMHYDEPTGNPDEPATVNLAFSVAGSAKSQTRLSDGVTQENSTRSQYRDLDMNTLTLIPFSKQGKIESSDRPLRLFDGSGYDRFYENKDDIYGGFYLYQGFNMMRGTASFLVYAKASEATPTKPEGVDAKSFYGSLVKEMPLDLSPDGITFSPETIATKADADKYAKLLADYLTYIAEAQATDEMTSVTYKWANISESQWRVLFLNFTGQENDGNLLMAGSSANVMAHVNALYSKISALSYETGSLGAKMKANILSRIKDYTATGLSLTFEGDQLTGIGVGTSAKDYPAIIGLPDGAAALQWAPKNDNSGYAFIPRTETSTTANMNTITRYCYPAALWYYANSQINTSNKSGIDDYYSSDDYKTWPALLGNYENTSSFVTGNTTAVAIQDPLQYAVARLEMTMQSDATLKDARGKTITPTGTSFPLTGIIVSNQHKVRFDFKPSEATGEESHADDKFIYDSQMKKSDGTYFYLSTTEQKIPSTLALQSYDGEEVTIIMEFRNDSGQDFHSKTGIIYRGTKFYLIGKIKPNEKTNPDDYEKRVFTQDHVTTVDMKVVSNTTTNSLENAYNVLPDILGGRLEVGVQLTPKWYFATPVNIPME